ncbi:outer membrane murein-binding lipoprotein Lpp [Bradyrhizobium sp. GM24.11]
MISQSGLKARCSSGTLFQPEIALVSGYFEGDFMQDVALELNRAVPFFGARAFARKLLEEAHQLNLQFQAAEHERKEVLSKNADLAEAVERLGNEVKQLRAARDVARQQLEYIGAAPLLDVDTRRRELQTQVDALNKEREEARAEIAVERDAFRKEVEEARQTIVETRETALLQEIGIYEYRHPLTDAVAYEQALDRLRDAIKSSGKKDGGAVLASTSWTVGGSEAEGRKMTREISKLMLRAFNAEADNLVRSLKPYKLNSAIERLRKAEEAIRKLGATLQVSISPAYAQLRIDELALTADFLQKQA